MTECVVVTEEQRADFAFRLQGNCWRLPELSQTLPTAVVQHRQRVPDLEGPVRTPEMQLTETFRHRIETEQRSSETTPSGDAQWVQMHRTASGAFEEPEIARSDKSVVPWSGVVTKRSNDRHMLISFRSTRTIPAPHQIIRDRCPPMVPTPLDSPRLSR